MFKKKVVQVEETSLENKKQFLFDFFYVKNPYEEMQNLLNLLFSDDLYLVVDSNLMYSQKPVTDIERRQLIYGLKEYYDRLQVQSLIQERQVEKQVSILGVPMNLGKDKKITQYQMVLYFKKNQKDFLGLLTRSSFFCQMVKMDLEERELGNYLQENCLNSDFPVYVDTFFKRIKLLVKPEEEEKTRQIIKELLLMEKGRKG
jgi:hypothetical protein